MFPEHRELITELKQSDSHFQRIFDEHNTLDKEITKIESSTTAGSRHDEIETMKKQKLQLKDELYQIILKAEKASK